MNTTKNELIDKAVVFVIIVIFALLVVSALLIEGARLLQHSGMYNYFALNEPTLEIGSKNAIPLIKALELYKQKHQAYPLDLRELPATKDVVWLTFIYTYEPSPSEEKPQQYMISFRKRWSIHDRYCYYSGDNAWLRTSNACWDTIRSIWQARYRLSSNGIRGEVQHSHTAQQSVPDNHRDNAVGIVALRVKQFPAP